MPDDLMLPGDAWLMALCEDGRDSLVAALCERAYGTGADVISLTEVRRAVAEGRGEDILASMPWPEGDAMDGVMAAMKGITESLGGKWPA